MRVVLKSNCFPNDIIKVNGVPILFDDFGYAYMYPMLANAKGKLLSCEGINKKAVMKAQPILAFADNAFFGALEGLISMPIVSAIVRNLCRDKKIHKKLSKVLAEKWV